MSTGIGYTGCMKNFPILLCGLLAAAPALRADSPNPGLDTLTEWMTGSFDSRRQAEADTNYLEIHLQMARIWPERKDAVWLYVEQAAGWALERPYRQRVYRVSELDKGYESAVYTLEDPLRFTGAAKNLDLLAGITPDSLELREGCAIHLRWDGEAFSGSTHDKDCGSTLRGASYATSEVRITADLLESWDRGFDAGDEHVWGAENGPYLFRRQELAATDGR